MSSSKNRGTPDGPAACFLCAKPYQKGYAGIQAEGGEYEVWFCPACGLGRTEPFLTEQELTGIYSSTYRESDSTRFFSPIEKALRVLRTERCKRIDRYAGKKGKILDVGCGRGDFLLLMKERGWLCTGIELDKRVEAHGKRIGLDLRFGAIHEQKFPDGYFDAITLWHVFEHLRDPQAAIREFRRILKPGGLLMIAVPNAGSLQARLTGGGWFHLDPPFHLYHYSLKNIGMLLEKNGFKTVASNHLSIEYNPYGFIQSIYNAFGLKRNLLFDFLRSKGTGGAHLSLALVFLTLPIIGPLSFALAFLEAAVGHGGCMEVYAIKNSVK